ARVRLLSVNGTRIDAPMPMAMLNRLSTRPIVRTTRTDAQPAPHPPQAGRKPRRSLLALTFGSVYPGGYRIGSSGKVVITVDADLRASPSLFSAELVSSGLYGVG